MSTKLKAVEDLGRLLGVPMIVVFGWDDTTACVFSWGEGPTLEGRAAIIASKMNEFTQGPDWAEDASRRAKLLKAPISAIVTRMAKLRITKCWAWMERTAELEIVLAMLKDQQAKS